MAETKTLEIRTGRSRPVGIWHLFAGIIMAALGVYVWFNPVATMVALALYIGIIFIILGAGYITCRHYFCRQPRCFRFQHADNFCPVVLGGRRYSAGCRLSVSQGAGQLGLDFDFRHPRHSLRFSDFKLSCRRRHYHNGFDGNIHSAFRYFGNCRIYHQ